MRVNVIGNITRVLWATYTFDGYVIIDFDRRGMFLESTSFNLICEGSLGFSFSNGDITAEVELIPESEWEKSYLKLDPYFDFSKNYCRIVLVGQAESEWSELWTK